jgi:glycosyltransferase involved in cell wall biosynthesis
MNFGIVIGTFGSPAYISLQLESIKRFTPNTNVLLHDDCSNNPRLKLIAEHYNIDFTSTSQHLQHRNGDARVFAAGLRWAQQNKLDYLVKISRRFIPVKNWVSSFCEGFGHMTIAKINEMPQIQTQFIGLEVSKWLPLLSTFDSYNANPTMERLIGALSTDTVAWNFLADSGFQNNGNYLWWPFTTPAQYCKQAHIWNLDCSVQDFKLNSHGAS